MLSALESVKGHKKGGPLPARLRFVFDRKLVVFG
jgi:hypothetical protein